jgi:hypothetical protein
MAFSDAELQRVRGSPDTERGKILEQFSYIGIKIPAARRDKPPMSENRPLLFSDHADGVQLNDFLILLVVVLIYSPWQVIEKWASIALCIPITIEACNVTFRTPAAKSR